MNPLERQQQLGRRAHRARLAARRADATAILAWWPLSWLLGAWAAFLGAWATHLTAAKRIAHGRLRAELEAIDEAHRRGRRTMHRNGGGR